MSDQPMTRKVLAEYTYTVPTVERGYTGQTLYVNLSDYTIAAKPVTEEMKEKFIGGRGFGLWLLWHGTRDDTKWNDPENEIIISSGPIGGITQYPGSGKSLVVTISPLTDIPIDSNVGGHFGPLLKFSGWDAIEIQGKADREVIVVIDGQQGRITIEEAPDVPVDTHLIGEWLIRQMAEKEEDRYFMSAVSAGQGAEHTRIGCLNFAFYDRRRGAFRFKQAGRGGTGTVFRDKRLKALVVKSPPVRADSVHPADPERIARAGIRLHKEIHDYDDSQNRMRRRGTTYGLHTGPPHWLHALRHGSG
ncbi:MAG: aldehyde:ferredoxin oxidoreductase, partial [Thermoflexia bacterium]